MASLLAALAILPIAQLVTCQPSVSFPFNAQLPLAARLDQFYSYSFAAGTFRSDSDITYSLGDHPDWLSIESSTRRLYGTPRDVSSPDGVSGENVEIIATDSTGSTTMNSTIVVARNPAPKIQIPLEKQIGNFGNFSAPSSILSYPATTFTFSFDQDTFGRQGLNYYATSGDSSPLPAWIHFDGPSMTFSGQTPPFESLIQPPQTFDLSLAASDIVGFSATTLKFSIVVGRHKLTTDKPIIMLNATRGSKLNYDGLADGVELDGKQVSSGDLTVTTKSKPDWLNFDTKTWVMNGTPGDGAKDANFTITFKDAFSDALDVLMVVNVATGLFKSTLEDVNATPGSSFNLDLSKYFKNPSDINAKVSSSPGESWLKMDGLKISGDVPKSSKGSFKLYVDASSKSSDLSEKESINVNFLAPDGTTTTVSSPSTTVTTTATATSTDAGGVSDESNAQPGHLSTGEILLATIIPVIFVAVLLMLLVCYFRRRRAGASYLGSRYRAKISNPRLSTLRVNESEQDMREAVHAGAFVTTETQVFKPGKSPFGAGLPSQGSQESDLSSPRRSSATLAEMSMSDNPRSMVVDAARTTTVRSISNIPSEDGRQSWVTIDGAGHGRARSDDSSNSQNTDFTVPGSTHQVFSATDYTASGGRGDMRHPLGITLPTLDEMPSVQPTPIMAYYPGRSMDGFSPTRTSSAVLPPGQHITGGPVTTWHTASTAGKADGGQPNWVSLEGSDGGGSVATVQKPAAAATGQPSRYPGAIKPWYEAPSATSSKSFASDVSFGSSENWRIIGRLSPTKIPEGSYKELVDEAPFHPSRPGTAYVDATPTMGPVGSVPPLNVRKEGDVSPTNTARMPPSASIVSKLSLSSSTGRGWNRDDSGKLSEGSFKVFL